MSALDAILNRPRGTHRRGCCVCGGKTEAAIEVRITKLGENGERTGKAGTVRSQGVSLCAEHAIPFWERLVAQVEEVRVTVAR